MILDGVFLREPNGKREIELTKQYCWGFRLAAMSTVEKIAEQLRESGFENIQHIDRTKEMAPSVEDIDKKSRRVSLLRYLHLVGLVSDVEADNVLATGNQKEMYERGFYGYAIFVAEKPKLRN